MKIGYARVSTVDQDPQLQITALENAGCEKIFTEHASGTKEDRPVLAKMQEQLRKGDIVVVWKLDRLGRSLKHLLTVVDDMKENGVDFISITEGFDTTTPAGKMMFQVVGAMGEFERNLISERTKAGLQEARARGRKGGRKKKLSDKQLVTMFKMYDSKAHSVAEICRQFSISRPTFYKYVEKR